MNINSFIGILWELDKSWIGKNHIFLYNTKEFSPENIKINKPYYIVVYLDNIKGLSILDDDHYTFNNGIYWKPTIYDCMKEFIYHHAKKNNVTDKFKIVFKLNDKYFK